MLVTPWICRSCLSRLARPTVRRHIRSYATQSKIASNAVPPALLERAHNFADEHRELTSQLSQGFDARAAKQTGAITPIVNALQRWKKAEEVRHCWSQCRMRNC
jgi:peptide chain release factor 1